MCRRCFVQVVFYLCCYSAICPFDLTSLLDRYPYEAIRVVTSDGYGLLLERIPRYRVYYGSVSFSIVCYVSVSSFKM